MEIKKTYQISDETIGFLLDSAGRGACYWAESTLEYEDGVKEVISGRGTKITDRESEPEKKYTLTKSMVQKGLTVMAEKAPQDFADILTGDYDNNTGDAFLQFCLFGELVYQ